MYDYVLSMYVCAYIYIYIYRERERERYYVSALWLRGLLEAIGVRDPHRLGFLRHARLSLSLSLYKYMYIYIYRERERLLVINSLFLFHIIVINRLGFLRHARLGRR